MRHYEVEVKCLVGKRQALQLPQLLQERGYAPVFTKKLLQLNDYFVDGDIHKLLDRARDIVAVDRYKELAGVVHDHTVFSVRVRQNNDEVRLVVKATNSTSANHALKRAEFEAVVTLTLDQLGQIILSCGYTLQARWSADRTLYSLNNGMTLDLYFSPGYGYQAEFEKVVTSEHAADKAAKEIADFVQALGLVPVEAGRIERMFTYYNAHWPDFYGSQKVFKIA